MDKDAFHAALAALGNRTRLSIVEMIAEHADGDVFPAMIADSIGVARNLISSHLLVLEKAGIVTAEQRGRNRILRLDEERLREVGWAIAAIPIGPVADRR